MIEKSPYSHPVTISIFRDFEETIIPKTMQFQIMYHIRKKNNKYGHPEQKMSSLQK